MEGDVGSCRGEDLWTKSERFSITYRSRFSARREAVLRLNSRLRNMGGEPAPPGGHPLRDTMKFYTERVIRRIEHLAGKA